MILPILANSPSKLAEKNTLLSLSNSRFFFFYQVFLLWTLTTHRTAGEGRGHLFATLHMWNDNHIFLIASLVSTRLLLNEIYHVIELPFWLIDDVILSVCLFTWWFDSSSFVIAVWVGKPVDSNSHRLLPFYYKWTAD